jgi:hypothetical protein
MEWFFASTICRALSLLVVWRLVRLPLIFVRAIEHSTTDAVGG